MRAVHIFNFILPAKGKIFEQLLLTIKEDHYLFSDDLEKISNCSLTSKPKNLGLKPDRVPALEGLDFNSSQLKIIDKITCYMEFIVQQMNVEPVEIYFHVNTEDGEQLTAFFSKKPHFIPENCKLILMIHESNSYTRTEIQSTQNTVQQFMGAVGNDNDREEDKNVLRKLAYDFRDDANFKTLNNITDNLLPEHAQAIYKYLAYTNNYRKLFVASERSEVLEKAKQDFLQAQRELKKYYPHSLENTGMFFGFTAESTALIALVIVGVASTALVPVIPIIVLTSVVSALLAFSILLGAMALITASMGIYKLQKAKEIKPIDGILKTIQDKDYSHCFYKAPPREQGQEPGPGADQGLRMKK